MKIWGYIIATGTFILGILASALMLIRQGAQRERDRAEKISANLKAKIAKKSSEIEQGNREREDKAHEKSTNDDWSGFNDRM